MSSAAIINIVASSNDTSQVQVSSETAQSSSQYVSNPWPGGLAGVICTSPWSIV